ncbi:MAG TPA: TonB-dependent receptor [Bacteroidia bacterium]|nr:TonB-dependent receptor [Bacteroidia bacterium]
MKKYFLALLPVLFALASLGQHSLSGKITDKITGEPLFGATVYIPDLKTGVTTTVNGTYQLKRLPEGSFLVEVRYISYNSAITTVEIKDSTVINFTLEPAVTEVNEVVVTGVSAATDKKQNPVPFSIVPKQALLHASSVNIIDAISRQPGVSQVSTGPAVSKPQIRGLGYNRVVTLYNGFRQEGQQWGDEHGIEIDEYSVDRVEIIKGPGSLLYGSDAMAGVINFLPAQPVDEGRITGELLGNYQTNNRFWGWSAMNAGNINGIYWQARVSGKNASNYRNKYDGPVYNSGFNELNTTAFLGINRKWGYVQAGFNSFSQNVALPEGERDSLGNFIKPLVINDTTIEETAASENDLRSYDLNVPRQQINHYRAWLHNLLVFKKSRLGINLSWQQNQRKEFGDPVNPEQYEPYFVLNTITYDVKYYLPQKSGWNTTAGISGMVQSNSNKGTEFIIPGYALFDYGLFAVTRRTFGKLSVSGGTRFDQRSLSSEALYLDGETKFSSFRRTFNNVSGSLGGVYRFTSKLSLQANASRGFRSPNIAELASNGRHEGTFRYEYGNPDLKPETSLQFDLGLNYSSEHVHLEVSGFRNYITNYIYFGKLEAQGGGDSIPDPDEPAPAYLYTQGDAVLTGGEIRVDIHPHPLDWLHFENSFSYVEGTLNNHPDSSKHLPFMPPARWRTELRADFKKAGNYFSGIYLFTRLDNYFSQHKIFSENSTETPTPGYTLLSAGAGTSVTSKSGRVLFNLFISADNLLDRAYQSHLSRLKYAPENTVTGRTGILNMGRNYSFKVVVPLRFK